MKLVVAAEVYPTESVEKVAKAIKNIFPIEVSAEGKRVAGESGSMKSLERFQALLNSHAIRGSARKILESSAAGGKMSFALNKQAAYAGAVNFYGYSPLGPVNVEISDKNLEKIIDWLAPGDSL